MRDKSLTSLKKIKDPLLIGQDYRLSETSQTNLELDRQKHTLLQEIGKLSKIYFGLKEGKDRLKRDIIGFQTDRLNTLEELAKEVNLSLEDETEYLKKRSIELDIKQKEVEEKDTQAQLLRHKTTSLSLEIERKLEENEKMIDYISKNKGKYEKLLKEEQETLTLAKNDRDVTKRKKDEVEKLLQEVEEGKKSSELAWDKKNNDLELERLEIKSKLRYLKEEDKRLKIREKVLKDKEEALQRKIKEMV